MDPTVAQGILLDRRIAYAVTDQQLRVTDVGGVIEMLEGAPTGWLGRTLVDLVPELVGSEAALADILAGELPRLELSLVNRRTAGERITYLTMVNLPYRYDQGQIVGLLYFVEDHTEAGILKQHLSQSRNELRLMQGRLAHQNQELATANAELQRLDDLKSIFVSVAAHELRTPLTAIQGYVEVVMDEDVGPLTDRQRAYLGIVQEGARRLLQITSSLLDITRIEAGRMELILQPTELSSLVQSVAAELQQRWVARGQRVTVLSQPNLPLALCDSTRAAQIVGNLLSNAINYTPEGGNIRIAVGLSAEEGFLQVSVADDGVGIAQGEQEHLFRRFFRATSAAQTGASGAGLGLYITRSLVELHGGRIWVESTKGKGSTFYVTFAVAG